MYSSYGRSRNPMFKIVFCLIVVAAIFMVAYNVWLYFDTKETIRKYHCEPTGQTSQEIISNGNSFDTITRGLYQCDNGKRWLRIYDI